MENDENSRMDGLDGIHRGLSQQNKIPMPLSSKATAFSIAAIIGGGTSNSDNDNIGHIPTLSEEQHSPNIGPIGKSLHEHVLNVYLYK